MMSLLATLCVYFGNPRGYYISQNVLTWQDSEDYCIYQCDSHLASITAITEKGYSRVVLFSEKQTTLDDFFTETKEGRNLQPMTLNPYFRSVYVSSIKQGAEILNIILVFLPSQCLCYSYGEHMVVIIRKIQWLSYWASKVVIIRDKQWLSYGINSGYHTKYKVVIIRDIQWLSYGICGYHTG